MARGLRCPAGCGVLVPRLGLEPTAPAVKPRALTGPPGKSSLHFMMRACSARCDRLFPTSQPRLLPPSPGPATLALPSHTSGPWLLLSFWSACPASSGRPCSVSPPLATPPLLPSSRHFLDLRHSTFMSASACVDCLFPSWFTVRVPRCSVPFKEQRPCLFFPLLCSEGPAQASPKGCTP